MRVKKLGLCVAGIALLSFIYITTGEAKSTEYVAKVNGKGIKQVMLDAAMNNFIANQKLLGITVKDEDKEKLRKGILDELVSAELLYQESQKARLGDLKEEIEGQFETLKKGFESEDAFYKLLEERGLKEKDLKEDIKRGVYIKTYLEKKVYENISVSEEEKKAEYEKNKEKLDLPEQVRAAHILIRVAPDAEQNVKDEAMRKIEDLRKRVLSGEDFAKLAKANSEDGTAPNGGDLGYFRRKDMVEPFEEAAFSLEIGGISPVVETQFGYHIIKLLDKKQAHKLTYEEVGKDIELFLADKQKREALDKFVDGLKKKAKIEIY